MSKINDNTKIKPFANRYKRYDNNNPLWESIFLEIEEQKGYSKGYIENISCPVKPAIQYKL